MKRPSRLCKHTVHEASSIVAKQAVQEASSMVAAVEASVGTCCSMTLVLGHSEKLH